jgi:hypothetical protein
MNNPERLRAGQLSPCKRFQLSGQLTEFPREVFEFADSLEILDLSNNRLTSLPDDFSQLKQLKVAFFNNNQFEEFPQILAECPQLSMVSFKENRLRAIAPQALSANFRWLVLTNNQLTELPSSIGQLSKLQKLMLAGNQLRSLPPELAQCHSLELIRLAVNQLSEFPDFLLTLPRLAWIAYGGNPCCQALAAGQSAQAGLPQVPASQLELGDILGQGASGVIYQAQWHPGDSAPAQPTQIVAVKKFKGEITSDGSPLDEMQACIAAGSHPNLVNVLAQLDQGSVNGAEDGVESDRDRQAGLLFSFLPSDYRNLGNPPSLDSCTRDTYDEATRFTLPQIRSIAQGIAAATAHLHDRGILHGDLYAHNILVNSEGHSILGDFGAASFFEPESALAPALTQVEVRAFGCLLEDLLDRYQPGSENGDVEAAAIAHLRRLQQACMVKDPGDRPQFSAICQQLSQP